MAGEYVDIIRKNFRLLVRSTNPTWLLLTELSMRPAFREAVKKVKFRNTLDHNNAILYSFLSECSAEDAQEFVALLRQDGQDHVANIFDKQTDDVPMSEEHWKSFNDKADQLCRTFHPNGLFLNGLRSKGVLTKSDYDIIDPSEREVEGKCCCTLDETVSKLIAIVQRKPDQAFDDFISTLNETHQSHVVYILTGDGDERPTDDASLDLITSSRKFLSDNIQPVIGGLLDSLVQRKAITTADDRQVRSQRTRSRQIHDLLSILERRPQSAFDSFDAALRETHQEHVANKLFGVPVHGIVRSAESMPEEEENAAEFEYKKAIENDETFEKVLSNSDITYKATLGTIKLHFGCKTLDSIEALQQYYTDGTLTRILNQIRQKVNNYTEHEVYLTIASKEFDRAIEDFHRLAPMTQKHRKALDLVAEHFSDSLLVFDSLLDRLSLCTRRKETIKGQQTTTLQSKLLLEIVTRQPDFAFNELLFALKETEQSVAVKMLLGESCVPVCASEGEEGEEPYKEGGKTEQELIHELTRERDRLKFELAVGADDLQKERDRGFLQMKDAQTEFSEASSLAGNVLALLAKAVTNQTTAAIHETLAPCAPGKTPVSVKATCTLYARQSTSLYMRVRLHMDLSHYPYNKTI